MSTTTPFVGRHAEMKRFDKLLRCPKGQAILVVGQQGMGKTMLLERMAQHAIGHPDLKCGYVRYEVTPTDEVDKTMELMLDHAYDTADVTPGILAGTPQRKKQWRAFWKALGFGNLADLVSSLKRNPQQIPRDQLLMLLKTISRSMPENARALFFIDPEKRMQAESDQAWTILMRGLPSKIKLVFAQRPEDVLAQSEVVHECRRVVRLPENSLGGFCRSEIEELAEKMGTLYSTAELQAAVAQYNGHPYATSAALNLIKDGTPIDELPPDPSGVAEAQWNKICQQSKEAVKLFSAYAVLEVAAPDAIVDAVSELAPEDRQHLLAQSYLGGLFREEPDGRRIYHSFLADNILYKLESSQKESYGRRAVVAYEGHLTPGDEIETLAAKRLPEHAFAVYGKAKHLDVVKKVEPVLDRLGLWEHRRKLLERGIESSDSETQKAQFRLEIGKSFSYQNRYEEALESLRKARNTYAKAEDEEGQARSYAMLAEVFRKRNEWMNAQECLREAVGLSQKSSHTTARLVEAECHVARANIFFDTGYLDQAERALGHAKTVLSGLESIELDRKGRREYADVLHRIGNVWFYYEQLHSEAASGVDALQKTHWLENAGKMYEQAVDQLARLKGSDCGVEERRLLGFLHDHYSQWFFRDGKLDKARSEAEQASHLFSEVSQRDGEAYAQDHIGEIHLACGSLAFCRSQKGAREERSTHLQTAEKEFGEARECFQEAYDVFKELDKKDGQAWLLHHLGEATENLGDVCLAQTLSHNNEQHVPSAACELWDDALDKYSEARRLFADIGNAKEVLHARTHIADVEWKKESGQIPPAVDKYRSIIAGFFHKDFYKDLYNWESNLER